MCGGRCLGERKRCRCADAVGIFVARQHRGFGAAWQKSRDRAADHSDHGTVSRVQDRTEARVQRRQARRYRRKSPGENSRHLPDVAFKQVRLACVEHGKQERGQQRLLHALWRYGRRICSSEGRDEDDGIPPGRALQSFGGT